MRHKKNPTMSHSFIFMFSFTVTLGGIKQLHASFFNLFFFKCQTAAYWEVSWVHCLHTVLIIWKFSLASWSKKKKSSVSLTMPRCTMWAVYDFRGMFLLEMLIQFQDYVDLWGSTVHNLAQVHFFFPPSPLFDFNVKSNKPTFQRAVDCGHVERQLVYCWRACLHLMPPQIAARAQQVWLL